MTDLHEQATSGPDPRPDTRPRLAYLYVTPWRHEFADHAAGRVPSHRLFFAAELATLGYSVETFGVPLPHASQAQVFFWRMRQAWWAARGNFSAVVATHEAASYPILLLLRLGLRQPPVVVLTVAAPRATAGRGLGPALKRWLLRSAKLVTVYSRDQVPTLAERLPRTEVVFLPLGVDTAFFQPVPHRTPELDILAVGTNEGKDYPTLVQALPEGRRLTIVTDGENRRAAEPWAKGKDVEFRSDVPIRELRRMYATCSVMVIPLRDVSISSGQTVLLENWAMGTPLIVTDVPCVRDYMGDSPVSLVPEGDVEALRHALETLPARRSADLPFTSTATAHRLDELIRPLLRRRGPIRSSGSLSG